MERITTPKTPWDVLGDAYYAVCRLQEIENILGNDYDLERLKELVEADKEGKCVVLPCKVGQDAWFYASTMKELCKAKIIKAEINFFYTTQSLLADF